MSKRIPVALGVILCLALVLSLLPLAGSPVSSREMWEYKAVEIRRDPGDPNAPSTNWVQEAGSW